MDATTNRARAVALVPSALMAAVLAGCSPSPGSSADGAQGNGTVGSTPSASVAVVMPTQRMPLEPYFHAYDAVLAQEEPDREEEERRRERYEQSVADCMKRAGFEYFPPPLPEPESGPGVRDSLNLPFLPATRDEVARVGYGTDDPERDGAGPDANAEYVQSLGAQAQQEWALALGWHEEDSDGTVVASGGCFIEAAQDNPEPEPKLSRTEEFSDLIGAMNRVVIQDVPEDPRTALADAEWSQCMANAGYVFPDGPDADRRRRVGPSSAWHLAVVTPPDGQPGDYSQDLPAAQIPWEQRALVGSDRELAIALADFDCRAETGYVERVTEVRVDLEQQYVDANRAELERMLRAFEVT